MFLIFRAGRASANCQRPRNELREIFRKLYFRGRTFINGKKAAHPSLPCEARPKETCDLCRAHAKGATDSESKVREGLSKVKI